MAGMPISLCFLLGGFHVCWRDFVHMRRVCAGRGRGGGERARVGSRGSASCALLHGVRMRMSCLTVWALLVARAPILMAARAAACVRARSRRKGRLLELGAGVP